MKSIFIDLEFCEVDRSNRKERRISRFEVIQIGAVMLDEEYNTMKTFDQLVKPTYGEISPFIEELTGVTNAAVSSAEGFQTVMRQFLDWVGEEEVAIYSWSGTDWLQIVKEARQKEFEDDRLSRLYDNWVDFQMVFGKMLGVERQISLKDALSATGIAFEGHAHSAYADAYNTAELFKLTKDPVQFEAQAQTILEFMQPTPALSISLGNLFTPEILSKLAAG